LQRLFDNNSVNPGVLDKYSTIVVRLHGGDLQ
jgi:hypothetical protein